MREILQFIAIATLSGVKPKAYHIGSDECTWYVVQMTPRSCYVTLYKWHQWVVMLLCTNDTKELLCCFVQITPMGCYVAL
jgi:hypothetical protein